MLIVHIKLHDVLQGNPRHNTVTDVEKYLEGGGLEILENKRWNLASVFKSCPVTSVDIKWILSAHKLT
jgi:hypothetical protein